MAKVDDIVQAILYTSRAMNAAVPNVEAATHIAHALLQGGDLWTIDDLAACQRLIPVDVKLAKEVSYSGGITPAIFTEARAQVKKQRMA